MELTAGFFPMIIPLAFFAILWGCSFVDQRGEKKERSTCRVGISGGCLCDTCREVYIQRRLLEVEKDARNLEIKEFVRQVDDSIAEYRKRKGLTSYPSLAHSVYPQRKY